MAYYPYTCYNALGYYPAWNWSEYPSYDYSSPPCSEGSPVMVTKIPPLVEGLQSTIAAIQRAASRQSMIGATIQERVTERVTSNSNAFIQSLPGLNEDTPSPCPLVDLSTINQEAETLLSPLIHLCRKGTAFTFNLPQFRIWILDAFFYFCEAYPERRRKLLLPKIAIPDPPPPLRPPPNLPPNPNSVFRWEKC